MTDTKTKKKTCRRGRKKETKIEKTARERIEKLGISITKPRIAILAYLMTHHTHPQMEEIYNALIGDHPTLSLTSVYNTVKTLHDHGLVQVLTIDGHKVCIDEDTSMHAHLLCKRCSKVIDLPIQGIDERRETTTQSEDESENESEVSFNGNQFIEGHLVEEAQQYYIGVCKDCLDGTNC